MNYKIGIVGTWHLGCILSVAWSKLNFEVTAFDYDEKIIGDLMLNKPPIFEPDLEENIRQSMQSKKLKFTTELRDLKDCDFIFISYDTPVLEDDSSDVKILEDSVSDLSEIMKNNSIVIISSQSPVGLCSELRTKLKVKNKSLELAYSPENLRLGEAISCYLSPGRIILGTANINTEKRCLSLFSKITDNILTMNLESAELVKHGINSFLSTSIVFANNLADICEFKNADISDVVQGMKSDVRIGEKAYLAPGIGFSGGTLGRDLKVLEKINNENGTNTDLFGSIHLMNENRKYSIVNRIKNILGKINEKKILVLGVTYKPGTSTLRRSLPLEIVNELINQGVSVVVYDPKADYSELKNEPKFIVTKSIQQGAENADMILLLTEWPEFREFDWQNIINLLNQPIFFDSKNFINKTQMLDLGFQYYSVGRK